MRQYIEDLEKQVVRLEGYADFLHNVLSLEDSDLDPETAEGAYALDSAVKNAHELIGLRWALKMARGYQYGAADQYAHYIVISDTREFRAFASHNEAFDYMADYEDEHGGFFHLVSDCHSIGVYDYVHECER